MLKISISFISIFLCLNLGKAQTQPSTTPQAPAATTVPPAAPPPGSVDPLIGIISSIKKSPGKFDEYQSICRENEYDTVAFIDPELQQKRIEILNEKIKNSTTPNKLKIRLLKEFVDQNKNSEAEKYYSKLKEEKITEEDGKIADAIYSVANGDLKKAETTLAKVILDNPQNKEALVYLAEIYLLDQNYFESIAAYYDLIKLTKENYDLQLCEIQTLDSQHNEAEKTCKKASEKFEKNPYPYIYLGISQREKMNYDEAIKMFKNSLRKKQTEMGYACLAEVFYIKENYTNAVELFKRASKIFPGSIRSLLGLAWAQLKNKQTSESLEAFKAACSKSRTVKTEIRRAYKLLSEEKSNSAKQFADLAQNCTD